MIPVRDTTVKRGLAPVTAILIIFNLVLFFEELKAGEPFFREFRSAPLDLYRYLIQGTSSFLAIHKSILVSGFMHAGYIHLIGNLIFLSVFGPPVEKRMGILRFSVFYLLSIFFSFYTHALIYPHSPVPVMGASGAIAAVMGSYLVLYPTGRVLTIIPLILMLEVVEIPSIIFILIWFAIQGANGYLSIETQSSIAWFSHIGGFLFGFINGIHERWSR
jgi:membrane associated rhomboid family serine protease